MSVTLNSFLGQIEDELLAQIPVNLTIQAEDTEACFFTLTAQDFAQGGLVQLVLEPAVNQARTMVRRDAAGNPYFKLAMRGLMDAQRRLVPLTNSNSNGTWLQGFRTGDIALAMLREIGLDEEDITNLVSYANGFESLMNEGYDMWKSSAKADGQSKYRSYLVPNPLVSNTDFVFSLEPRETPQGEPRVGIETFDFAGCTVIGKDIVNTKTSGAQKATRLQRKAAVTELF